MFDVRPVDKAGDLDWKKIQAVGGQMECVGDESQTREVSHLASQQDLYARMLKERAEHDLAIRAEREKRNNERIQLFEAEKKHWENQQRCLMAKMDNSCREKEAALVAQKNDQQRKRAEFIRLQAFEHQEELKKIAEVNRQKQEAYESQVMLERAARDQEMAAWLENEKRQQDHAEWLEREKEAKIKAQELRQEIAKRIEKVKKKKKNKSSWFAKKDDAAVFSWQDLFAPPKFALQFDSNSSLRTFAVVALILSLSVGSITYASRGFGIKGKVLGSSVDGMANLNSAVGDIAHQNFEGSSQKFDDAYANFAEGSKQLDSMGGMLLDTTRFIPFASKVSSGKNAIEAGKHFAAAGKAFNEVAKVAAGVKNSTNSSQQLNVSLLDVLSAAQTNIIEAKKELDLAQQNMDRIAIDDLPEDKRDKFLLVKQQLPDLRSALEFFLNNSHILADLLGGNGPRKYLFLFQNNSEMRATGGFVGSYGLLDIANGHIKKFFIDGIFNPDGQLKDRIVPPLPIQKISANWSMHDSNWFADFPMSAKKAISFYEKTGGPTADGVITLTPTVMQKLLEITGPIEMPEYDVTLDSENFVELTQNEVEVDYDKVENKPKKILSDLAPLILEKLLSSKDVETISKTMQAFLAGLQEKHILFYSENAELEQMISEQGWSGEIVQTSKDYLSVINTNVNGYKTDAVVTEKIEHSAQIQIDGSIIDTVSITRKHNGGNSQYSWLNKVNADYMRVYVPVGSKLLEVTGQTREVSESPVDYDALGFKRDSDVQNEENSIEIDEKSGTRVYQENGKTVFANWTYVSPQETMTITYKYVLPFKLFQVYVENQQQVDSYSLVAQKQSGSIGSEFSSQISYPENYAMKWNFPTESKIENNIHKTETKLDTDRFIGTLFVKK